jgi:hypothetical protein
MSARSYCYGSIFPGFTRLENNKPLNRIAFSALAVSHGIGAQSRTLDVKPDGWDKCVACADYRTCYDLSLSKLVMNTILANGWYRA